MISGFGKLPMSAAQGLYPIGGAISRLPGKWGDSTEAQLTVTMRCSIMDMEDVE